MNVSLILLTGLFICFVVLGNEDPYIRSHLGIPLSEQNWRTPYKVLYDFGVGGLVSVLFYWLLVRIPENAKRRRVRRGLERQFRAFKTECLSVILGTVEGVIDLETVEGLLEQRAFRDYFDTQVSPDQNRWHVFLNRLDRTGLRNILFAIELLREEVNFAVSAIDIPKDESFEFLKRLSRALQSVRNADLGYDDIKPLGNFLWTIFSGFSFVTGYQQEDPVTKTIGSI